MAKKDFALGMLVGSLSVSLAYALVKVDYLSSQWECDWCDIQFRPPFKEYALAPHTFSKRKLICPVCGKKAYLKCVHDYKKVFKKPQRSKTVSRVGK